MVKIIDLLNSDSSGDESGSSSTTPSAMSLGGSTSSISSGSYESVPILHREPSKGLAQRVKKEIEENMAKRTSEELVVPEMKSGNFRGSYDEYDKYKISSGDEYGNQIHGGGIGGGSGGRNVTENGIKNIKSEADNVRIATAFLPANDSSYRLREANTSEGTLSGGTGSGAGGTSTDCDGGTDDITAGSYGKNIKFPTLMPKSKIRKDLIQKKLVQIAIRRKSLGKDGFKTVGNGSAGSAVSKLHIKSLEAGLRVKLTLAPDLLSLYNSLTPHTNRQSNVYVLNSNNPRTSPIITNDKSSNEMNLVSKNVQLIDNNLVNLSVFSNKILKSFDYKSTESQVSTFNSLNTAVHSLFNINEFSLVRITRSTTTDRDGSTLLKFETAKPGEFNLIDEDDFIDELSHSIGKAGDQISNLFIKKVIARPRYKSDMKIYLIPNNSNCSLYVDKRMLERDLINGVVDIPPFYKDIYCAFEYNEIIQNYKELLRLSQSPDSINPSTNETKLIPSSTNIQVPIGGMRLPPISPPIRD